MKVLLVGDYSNYHAALAQGLRALGQDVTVASDGCTWLRTATDIDLSRRRGLLGGGILFAKTMTVLSRQLRGYDVVHFRAPNFIDLRPVWEQKILEKIARNNGRLFLSALSTDTALVRNLTSPNPALGYSEWQLGTQPTVWAASEGEARRRAWLAMTDYTEAFYSKMNGVVSALYEYHRITQAEYPHLPLAYGGIPVDTSALPAPRLHPAGDGPVRILYAVHKGREGEKGADILLAILWRLERELPGKVEIVTPPNMPYTDFVETLSKADIVCDQLYSYTPATTALLAMAMGVVPLTGGEEEFYGFIGENELRPSFNPDPRDPEGTYLRLKELVLNRERLAKMSAQGPEFVARHNDMRIVAQRFIDFWENKKP